VFGIALATVILPRLAEYHATSSREVFSDTLDWALRLVVVIGVPAAIGLALLAEPLFATLFLFEPRDVEMAAAALRAYAPGLLGFILVKVLAPGYFARHDTGTPVRVGVQALVSGMALSVAFVVTLVETGWAPPHSGIAAATSCSALLNAGLLLLGLRRNGVYRARPGWRALMLRVALPSLAMAAALEAALGFVGDWHALGRLARLAWLAALVSGGAAVYFGACFVAGMRPSEFRAQSKM
jgi:putative peptidoglycan lipid II flippase